MKITILLFAGVADAVGAREFAVEVEDGLCVRDVWKEVSADWSSEACNVAAGAAFAVNERYVRPEDFVLRDGDTLAVIPPVSGG